MSKWYVYIIRCSTDGSLYTGITTDLERRLLEHNTSNRGARYTRTRRPVALVWNSLPVDRSFAMKAEIGIKKKTRKQKEAYISNDPWKI